MVAYFTIAFLAVFLALIPTNKKFGLNCAFLVITIFLAIRYQWGNDYPAYLSMYQDFNTANFDLFDIEKNAALRGGKEYGWVILNRIFGALHLGFFGMIIALTLFENWVIRRMIIRFVEPRSYWIAIAFYVFTTWFPTDASMMRQYLCVCLYILVVELMTDKKVRGYLFWAIGIIMLGTTFHLSNMITMATLPAFYIHFKNNNKTYILMVGIGILLFLWNTYGFQYIGSALVQFMIADEGVRSYAVYAGEQGEIASSGLGVIFSYIKLVVLLFILPKIIEKDKQSIVLLVIASYFIAAIGAIIPPAGRMAIFFTIWEIILWPWLFKFAKRHPWMFVVILVQIIIMGKEITDFFYDPTWHDYFFEYHTIFDAPNWM